MSRCASNVAAPPRSACAVQGRARVFTFVEFTCASNKRARDAEIDERTPACKLVMDRFVIRRQRPQGADAQVVSMSDSAEHEVLRELRKDSSSVRKRRRLLSHADRASILAFQNDPCAASVAAAGLKRRPMHATSVGCPPDATLSPALEARIQRSPLWDYSVDSLRSACGRIDALYDSRSTKGQLIYEIVANARPSAPPPSPPPHGSRMPVRTPRSPPLSSTRACCSTGPG